MNFDESMTANAGLLKGTCLGCHAQGGSQALVSVGVDDIPQVMHSESTDLAAGNFAFITGMKGSGASNSKGHNIAELTGSDGTFATIPGFIQQGTSHKDRELNCAGTGGCHGSRPIMNMVPTTPTEGISGAHHANIDAKLDVADSVNNSYRFLHGVKGLEDADWQYTRSDSDHNEYFGITAPPQLGCGRPAVSCHIVDQVKPPNGTMSQFCATCHGNFHTLTTAYDSGIGASVTSPFIRHPTDIILPSDGREYSLYTSYDLNVPIARTTVPDTAYGNVTPGSDVVICLSCHMAHASDYPDMLRWDYTNECKTNSGTNTNCGCFTCHTAKDGETAQ